MNSALAGVRVIEFGQFIAVPAAGKILADMGAEVVKVEPVGGETARHIGAYGDAIVRTYNGDKRAVAVDLKDPDGTALARRLVGAADVVLQNQRDGVMDALGLGPTEVRAANPDVIYASVSGFGTRGPSRGRAGFDIAAQAESGMMWVTGEAGRDPQRIGFPVVDAAAGHVLAEAVLGAYIRRLRFGGGQDIEVSLLEVAIHLQGANWSEYFTSGRGPERKGNGQPTVAPAADVVPTADGAIVLSAYTPGHFTKLCALIDRPDLDADERFATNALRVTHREALLTELSAAFRRMKSADALELMTSNGVVAAGIHSYEQAAESPDVQAAGIFVDLVPEDGTDGASGYRTLRSPWRTSAGDPVPRRPAPRLGRHTRELMTELGYPPAEIDALRERGTVRTDDS